MARIESTDDAPATGKRPGVTHLPKAERKVKPRPAWITTYLIVYNAYSAVAWLYPLVLIILHLSGITHNKIAESSAPPFVRDILIGGLAPLSLGYGPKNSIQRYPWAPTWLQIVLKRSETTFSIIGDEVQFIQTCALLEVLHSALGWVRSPFGTVLAQVSSRLILVWGIAPWFPSTHTNPIYTSMVIAWSVTEVIRYPYYALNLLDVEPYFLLWLRYTTFYVLYPLGVGSEAFLMFSTLPLSSPPKLEDLKAWGFTEWLILGLYTFWWPALWFLYTYMIKQRRKVLGGAKAKKTKAE